jgi:transcriptional regulator
MMPGAGPSAEVTRFSARCLDETTPVAIDGNPTPEYNTHIAVMPNNEMPSGALMLLILRVLRAGPLHGYAIAQRIHVLSSEILRVEEGALYPTLQRILLKGWVTAEWGISDTNRKVRFYRLTSAGRKELDTQLAAYELMHHAIQSVLKTA